VKWVHRGLCVPPERTAAMKGQMVRQIGFITASVRDLTQIDSGLGTTGFKCLVDWIGLGQGGSGLGSGLVGVVPNPWMLRFLVKGLPLVSSS
jgi:hypothetical protein